MNVQGDGSTAAAGWYADPSGRHQYRYWDGTAWTDHVADGGVASQDRLTPTSAGVAADADADLDRLLAQETGDPAFRHRTDWILAFGKADYTTALQAVNEALRLVPDSAEYLTFRAMTHYAMGDTVAATTDIDAALAVDPSHKEALEMRGSIEAEAAQKVAGEGTTLTHFFVSSGNDSLIASFYQLFQMGTPAYGGHAARYRANRSELGARKEAAGESPLPFDGRSAMGSTETAIPSVTDALAVLQSEAMLGSVSIAYAAVDQSGCAWVREVYDTLLGEAAQQGILPFHILTTSQGDAAQYLIDSFEVVSAS